jgi:hypothetical protein
MGISLPWPPRIFSLLLLILGIAATAAVLPLPASKVHVPTDLTPAVQILLDMQSLESGADRTWEGLEDAVQAILSQGGGARFSVLATGKPAVVLVPQTADLKGLQIIAGRVRYQLARGSHPDLTEALASLALAGSSTPEHARTIVITSLPIEELERLPASMLGSSDLRFVALSRSDTAIQYGQPGTAGGITWTRQPGDSFMSARRAAIPRVTTNPISPIQWMAIAALVLLMAEYGCSLASRSRIKVRTFA